MKYFTEDTKLKELKAIYEAMEASLPPQDADNAGMSDKDMDLGPYELRQKKTDAERQRRAAATATVAKGEKKVNPMDFDSEKTELEDKIGKLNHAIEFMTKQMEISTNPEDQQDYPGAIQAIVDSKNLLQTRLMAVSDQKVTQSSVVAPTGSIADAD